MGCALATGAACAGTRLVRGPASWRVRERIPDGQSRLLAAIPLHNQRPVPPGVDHDVEHPLPVTITLHWETGTEQLDTLAVEWQATSSACRSPTSAS